jgi:DNA-binding CsgD family transcriptional regulator
VVHRYLPPGWEAVLVESVAQQFINAWDNALIAELAPNIPLHTHVETAAARWRIVTARLGELWSLANTLPPPVQLAGLTCIAVTIKDRAREYVRQCFNFDLDQKCFVSGSVGPQLAPDGEISLSLAEIHTLTAVCQDAALCENLLLAGLDALWGAQQIEGKEGVECMRAAVEAMLTILHSLPLFVGPLMESPTEPQQEQGMLSVAGWIATQISLERNRRLRQALAQDDLAVDAPRMSPFTTLLEQLPAYTYEVWYQEGWTTVEELRTRIASLMEGYGIDPGLNAHLSEESLRKAHHEISQWGSDTSLQDFAARQEASQRLDEVAAGAGLSPREAEVLALQRQGLTQEQIGTQLDLPRTTVKTYIDRGAEKMYKEAREKP